MTHEPDRSLEASEMTSPATRDRAHALDGSLLLSRSLRVTADEARQALALIESSGVNRSALAKAFGISVDQTAELIVKGAKEDRCSFDEFLRASLDVCSTQGHNVFILEA